MKGLAFVIGLIGTLVPLQALYARWAAKRDPIDREALKKVDFRNATGAGGYPDTGRTRKSGKE